MATEDTDTEAGGQTDDSDAGGDEPEPDATDDAPERQAAKPEEGDRLPRKQRRANAMREAKEQREAAIREAAELRQRVSAAEAAAQEVRARLEERERTSQTNSKAEQTMNRVKSLRQQAKDQIVLAASLKGSEASAAWDKHQELMDEAEDLRRELWAEGERQRLKGELQQNAPNPHAAQALVGHDVQYPWLTSNPEAVSMADTRLTYLINSGRPFNRQTVVEALAWTAKALRLGGHAPSDASRQRYIGTGQRDGAGDDGASNGTMTVEDVRNNLGLRRMALSLYNNLDEQQAYAKFAKEIGTKALRPDG
jgi:hypothetical protein